jgi:hypothetical protein
LPCSPGTETPGDYTYGDDAPRVDIPGVDNDNAGATESNNLGFVSNDDSSAFRATLLMTNVMTWTGFAAIHFFPLESDNWLTVALYHLFMEHRKSRLAIAFDVSR